MAPTRDPSTRSALAALCISQFLLLSALGLARWASFHNQTFDLAFYARMAWGMTHQNHWEPLVGADIHGLHLSPILQPLGAIGAIFGSIPPVLLIAQAAAISLAAYPLARIGERHLGQAGVILAGIAWLLYPNLGHVAGYEAHPGTMAVLPLAWIAFAIDGGSIAALVLGTFWVAAFREDLALVTALCAIVFAWRHRPKWRWAAGCLGASIAYAALFFFILHPRYAPPHGSLQLHFGRFGNSFGEIATFAVTHPGVMLAHLFAVERIAYLPKLLLPLALLTLRRPWWIIPALPLLAINLLSDWPSMLDIDEHYVTPVLVFFVAGALEGAASFGKRYNDAAILAILACALVGHFVAGGTPMSIDFDRARFHRDEDSIAAREVLAHVPDDADIQAPDALLSHLAARPVLRRGPPPEVGTRFVVLDAEVRRRYSADEDLIRTVEEPILRNWLARDDHRLVAASGRWLLLERGHSPRSGIGGHAIVGRADPDSGHAIARCLAVLGGSIEGDRLILDLVARGACDSDLAIRIGLETPRPRRVDLLFGGLLSPAQLHRGDRLRSIHRLTPAEISAFHVRGYVLIGALRSSGARPEHSDPLAIEVPLLR